MRRREAILLARHEGQLIVTILSVLRGSSRHPGTVLYFVLLRNTLYILVRCSNHMTARNRDGELLA